MDYAAELARLGHEHAKARSEAAKVEAARDLVIRKAHRHGAMSIRTIAGLVGVSHQRVAQILAAGQP